MSDLEIGDVGLLLVSTFILPNSTDAVLVLEAQEDPIFLSLTSQVPPSPLGFLPSNLLQMFDFTEPRMLSRVESPICLFPSLSLPP